MISEIKPGDALGCIYSLAALVLMAVIYAAVVLGIKALFGDQPVLFVWMGIIWFGLCGLGVMRVAQIRAGDRSKRDED